jgi:hypothetical protein
MDNIEIVSPTIPLVKGKNRENRSHIFSNFRAVSHKIRKAMVDRDAYHKFAGLIELDDTYFGAAKPREMSEEQR